MIKFKRNNENLILEIIGLYASGVLVFCVDQMTHTNI